MLTEKLLDEAKTIWERYYSHPFIQEIGSGTLSVERFKYYMIQDYLYLYEYAKVFALGVVKSESHTLMELFSGLVHSTLHGEMNTHRSYMKRLHITEEMIQSSPAALTNTAYTTYMLKVAYEGDVLDILTAILSCALSYQFIGRRLAEIPGAAEHEFFGEWIESYACQEYAEMNDTLIHIINKLGENISEEKFERLKRIFITCSRYEALFWDMAYSMEGALPC